MILLCSIRQSGFVLARIFVWGIQGWKTASSNIFCLNRFSHKAPVQCFVYTDVLLPSCGHCYCCFSVRERKTEVAFMWPLQNQIQEQIHASTSKYHPEDLMHFYI